MPLECNCCYESLLQLFHRKCILCIIDKPSRRSGWFILQNFLKDSGFTLKRLLSEEWTFYNYYWSYKDTDYFNAWNRIVLKVIQYIQCIANVTLPKFCMCSDVLGIFFLVSLDPIKRSGMFLSLKCLEFWADIFQSMPILQVRKMENSVKRWLLGWLSARMTAGVTHQ